MASLAQLEYGCMLLKKLVRNSRDIHPTQYHPMTPRLLNLT